MRPIKIITDSTCDLNPKIKEEYGIAFTHPYIILGDRTVRDDGNFDTQEIFNHIDESGKLTQTAAYNVNDFLELFSKWIDEGYNILYIGIGSKLSSTYQNAIIAAEDFSDENLYIIDSKSVSAGLGSLVMAAGDMLKEGKDIIEIHSKILAMVQKVEVHFFVDTMKYLVLGGRCSALQGLMGNTLKIKPHLTINDGAIGSKGKFRGSWSKVSEKFYDTVMESAGDAVKTRAFVIAVKVEKGGTDYFKKRLLDDGFEDVIIVNAGPSIATHCGPGTCGIVFITK